MINYQELIAELSETEEKLDFLKQAHREHVEQFLGLMNQELKQIGMSLEWAKKDSNPNSGLFEMTIYDQQAEIMIFEIDSCSQNQFASFKPYLKEALTPVVAAKKRALSMTSTLQTKQRSGVQKI
jgi:hypothetical protein